MMEFFHSFTKFLKRDRVAELAKAPVGDHGLNFDNSKIFSSSFADFLINCDLERHGEY
jgi:hypothetical protein